jgi:hypothetical protein
LVGLHLDPNTAEAEGNPCIRDVSTIGHHGAGPTQYAVVAESQLPELSRLIHAAAA